MLDETESIRLGENIYLYGFNKVDSSSMIIIKKIIGSHVKKIHETTNFEKIDINLEKKDREYTINIQFNEADGTHPCKETNIFVCIDDAFKKLNYNH